MEKRMRLGYFDTVWVVREDISHLVIFGTRIPLCPNYKSPIPVLEGEVLLLPDDKTPTNDCSECVEFRRMVRWRKMNVGSKEIGPIVFKQLIKSR